MGQVAHCKNDLFYASTLHLRDQHFQYRHVAYRSQWLWQDLRIRGQARSLPTCKHDRFHLPAPLLHTVAFPLVEMHVFRNPGYCVAQPVL